MLDVGDTKRLDFTALDPAGSPADPVTVVLTVTRPDGTTQMPAVVDLPETGQSQVDYEITQHGRHVVRWVATDPDSAYLDVFSAADPSWPVLVGLAETKEHLNYQAGDDNDDEELRGFIASASAVVEDIVGSVGRRSVTETNSGGERFVRLNYSPVLAVTEVRVDGELVDPGEYTAAPSGLLAKRSGCFPAGFHNVATTYEVGRTVVPANVHEGTLELIRINWRPQQGGNYGPFDGGRGDDFGVSAGAEASLQGQLRLGFFIPNTVTERLAPHQRGPVVL